MKRQSISIALVLFVVACGEPIPRSGTTTLPGETATTPTTPAVPQGDGVAVVVTATAVEQPDGSIELCPPGMTRACPGIALNGEIDPDLVASEDNPVVVEVTGRYDGWRVLAGSAPVQVEYAANAPVEFDSLCPDLQGTSRINPDESLIQAITTYTGGRADYAAMWWDRNSAVLTVWFKGDDVSAHQEAIGQIVGDEPICVAGGARFSETELLEASDLLNGFVDSRGLPLATSGYGLGGRDNRIDLPVGELDAATRDALAELVGERVVPHPFIYMLDAPLAELPEPIPVVEGDVEILTSRTRAGGGMAALGLYTVAYDAALNCVYLGEGSTGVEPENSDRTVPVWPFGYSATSSPLTIYDYDGNVVAVEGDEIELGGGFVDIGFVEGNSCDAAGAWIVNR